MVIKRERIVSRNIFLKPIIPDSPDDMEYGECSLCRRHEVLEYEYHDNRQLVTLETPKICQDCADNLISGTEPEELTPTEENPCDKCEHGECEGCEFRDFKSEYDETIY